MIPYGRQDINQEDIEAVVSVLTSDFLTQGPRVPEFERQVADYCGAAHGVAVNSATSALHIACLAMGLGPGDWLWTSPITFLASANCARYCGAGVDFVDIDAQTGNLSPAVLEAKLERAAGEGRLPKVVVAVHLAGQSCDMQAIAALASRYGFRVIEDASHAIGGRYADAAVGSCQYSDATVFSFHPVKIITTAEGGLVTTQDAGLAARMALFRSHGMTRDPQLMTHEPDGPWYYQQVELGYNYRMTELQGALGLSQLARIDAYVARRHVLADRYDEMLRGLPLTTPWQHPQTYSGLHLYVIRLDLKALGTTRRAVFDFLRAAGIGVNVHYIPVHTQPYYRQFGFCDEEFPQAMRYYEEAISLPLYAGLAFEQQNLVVEALKEALKA